MLRRLLTCLAFATWCFLDTWVEYAEGRSAYFARYEPIRTVAIPVLLWELALTAGMFGFWEFCRRRNMGRSRPIAMLFLASCSLPVVVAANAFIRAAPSALIPLIHKLWFVALAVGVAAVLCGWALLRPLRASLLMRSLFLYSWPVLAVVLIQASRATLFRYPAASYADRPLAAALGPPPRPVRVVWIIFDELSQTIAFDKRPSRLQMPNLDRLRKESFYTSRAKSPGGSTRISMPALILGEHVIRSSPDGPDTLYVRPRFSSQSFSWSTKPNVFDSAREMGFNTAIAGWYHPYGRLLNGSLTKCYWTADPLLPGIREPTEPESLAKAMLNRARDQLSVFYSIVDIHRVSRGKDGRELRIERFDALLDRAREMAADPSIGLVLIHLPIPHPPGFYDLATATITANGRRGYVDNVALADRTFGVLRRSIEQAGLWDRTAVLVSADHGWRTAMWRTTPEWTAADAADAHGNTSGVPFVLKLPGQSSGETYDKAFDTVVTRGLITEILSGRLANPAAIAGSIEGLGAEAR